MSKLGGNLKKSASGTEMLRKKRYSKIRIEDEENDVSDLRRGDASL